MGVIDGKHKMVHNFNGIGVEMVDIENFMDGENWWVRRAKSDALPGEEVAKRALSRVICFLDYKFRNLYYI